MHNSNGISAELVDMDQFTPRQKEVIELLCTGLEDKPMANQLAISIKTLQVHLEHIYTKLRIERHGVNTRCAAILTLVARGMVKISVRTMAALLVMNMVNLEDAGRCVGRVQARPPVSRGWSRDA